MLHLSNRFPFLVQACARVKPGPPGASGSGHVPPRSTPPSGATGAHADPPSNRHTAPGPGGASGSGYVPGRSTHAKGVPKASAGPTRDRSPLAPPPKFDGYNPFLRSGVSVLPPPPLETDSVLGGSKFTRCGVPPASVDSFLESVIGSLLVPKTLHTVDGEDDASRNYMPTGVTLENRSCFYSTNYKVRVEAKDPSGVKHRFEWDNVYRGPDCLSAHLKVVFPTLWYRLFVDYYATQYLPVGCTVDWGQYGCAGIMFEKAMGGSQVWVEPGRRPVLPRNFNSDTLQAHLNAMVCFFKGMVAAKQHWPIRGSSGRALRALQALHQVGAGSAERFRSFELFVKAARKDLRDCVDYVNTHEAFRCTLDLHHTPPLPMKAIRRGAGGCSGAPRGRAWPARPPQRPKCGV